MDIWAMCFYIILMSSGHNPEYTWPDRKCIISSHNGLLPCPPSFMTQDPDNDEKFHWHSHLMTSSQVLNLYKGQVAPPGANLQMTSDSLSQRQDLAPELLISTMQPSKGLSRDAPVFMPSDSASSFGPSSRLVGP